jgi:hypothetical protein
MDVYTYTALMPTTVLSIDLREITVHTIGCRWSDRGGEHLANKNEIQHVCHTDNNLDNQYCSIVYYCY